MSVVDGDMQLDETGDIVIGNNGDFVSISGLDSLTQDLRNRILTPRGSYPEDSSWGLGIRQFFQLDDSPGNRDMIARLTAEELGRDERIDGPPQVNIVSFDPNGIRMQIRPTIDGEAFTFFAEAT